MFFWLVQFRYLNMKRKRILFTGTSLPDLQDLDIPENISVEYYPLINIDFSTSSFMQDEQSLFHLQKFNLFHKKSNIVDTQKNLNNSTITSLTCL